MGLYETAVEWLTLSVLLFGPGLAVAVFWSPFLLVDRLRSLFRTLPPKGSMTVTYPIVMVLLSLPWVIGTGVAIVLSPLEPVPYANAILDVVLPLSIVYVIGLPVLGGFVLPKAGVDWDPKNYDIASWASLIVGGIWYTVFFAVPLFVIALIIALPMH
ncbi:MAG: hypothetical protein SV377_07660 [Halobacteria archaeon]|nr:hypothetical protein [Halobacteria archaeon]